MIRFTEHAIERFVEHWRPGMGLEEAEQTLRSMIARAARTRRNARGTGARIYLAETERGERICLVVQGAWVVTVLARRGRARCSSAEQGSMSGRPCRNVPR